MPKTYHNILLVGPTGTGKTTLIQTLPGKKLIYLFDPNAQASLGACSSDDELLPMQPSLEELDLLPRSIFKRSVGLEGKDPTPSLYKTFIKDLQSQKLDPFSWIIVDSLTSLNWAIGDGVLLEQQKVGAKDARTDYMIMGSRVVNLCRYLAGLPINILMTAHYRKTQDELTSRVLTQLDLPGSARGALPRMFDLILSTSVRPPTKDTEEPHWFISTIPTSDAPESKKSLRIPHIIDVTLDWTEPLSEQGLGAILPKQEDVD